MTTTRNATPAQDDTTPAPAKKALARHLYRDVVLKRTATVATGVTFVGVGLTGIAMTLGLAGGLANTVHVVLGVGFVAFAVLHILKHAKAIQKMLAKRVNQILVGTVAAAVAIMLLAGGGRKPMRPRGAPGATAGVAVTNLQGPLDRAQGAVQPSITPTK